MRLSVCCNLVAECPEPCPTVALLRPRSGHAQWVIGDRYDISPWVPATEFTDSFGNLCQRFTLPAGSSTIAVQSELEVEEDLAVNRGAGRTPVEQLPDSTLVYLLQSRYCPSDKLGDRARELAQGAAPGYEEVDRIRQWIHDHHEYRYGVSSESTDAIDTMAAGAGVCRDFAHIGVALCRGLKIPARVVVGYLHQLDPMDLHAWFEAFVGGRWYTFDATQKAPRGGRVVLAYGRDVADVAFLSNYGEMTLTSMAVDVQKLPASG